MIDWNSDDTIWMVNPMLSEREQAVVREARKKAPNLTGHIWIRSSGTTSANTVRWVALSKTAFLVAAGKVNEHLGSGHHDTWVRALPLFHVGGLAIDARAHLSGANVLEWEHDWEPETFHHFLRENGATLLSLVPTQLHDLVQLGLSCPPTMRAVIIGGAALEEDLYFRARELGWPVLPSYGMTEAASQVATATLDSLQYSEYPSLKILSHIQPRIEEDGRFSLLSQSLLTMALLINMDDGVVQLAVRDASDYFPTQDIVEIEDGMLRFVGRASQMIKVLGEQVSLKKLNQLMSKDFSDYSLPPYSFAILPIKDARKGSDLVLATDCRQFHEVEQAVSAFHSVVEKYERLSGIYFLPELPRSDIGKIKIGELTKTLGF